MTVANIVWNRNNGLITTINTSEGSSQVAATFPAQSTLFSPELFSVSISVSSLSQTQPDQSATILTETFTVNVIDKNLRVVGQGSLSASYTQKLDPENPNLSTIQVLTGFLSPASGVFTEFSNGGANTAVITFNDDGTRVLTLFD